MNAAKAMVDLIAELWTQNPQQYHKKEKLIAIARERTGYNISGSTFDRILRKLDQQGAIYGCQIGNRIYYALKYIDREKKHSWCETWPP